MHVLRDLRLGGIIVRELVKGTVVVVVAADVELAGAGEDQTVVVGLVAPEGEAAAATDQKIVGRGVEDIREGSLIVEQPEKVVRRFIEDEIELVAGLVEGALNEDFVGTQRQAGWGGDRVRAGGT